LICPRQESIKTLSRHIIIIIIKVMIIIIEVMILLSFLVYGPF